MQQLDQFRDEVDRQLKRVYGITWQDACGDLEPLVDALAAGESAEDFVERWARKNDLDPIAR